MTLCYASHHRKPRWFQIPWIAVCAMYVFAGIWIHLHHKISINLTFEQNYWRTTKSDEETNQWILCQRKKEPKSLSSHRYFSFGFVGKIRGIMLQNLTADFNLWQFKAKAFIVGLASIKIHFSLPGGHSVNFFGILGLLCLLSHCDGILKMTKSLQWVAVQWR